MDNILSAHKHHTYHILYTNEKICFNICMCISDTFYNLSERPRTMYWLATPASLVGGGTLITS